MMTLNQYTPYAPYFVIFFLVYMFMRNKPFMSTLMFIALAYVAFYFAKQLNLLKIIL